MTALPVARRAGRGRPLRFLVALGVGWVSLRVAMLWPVALAPPVPSAAAAVPALPFLPAALAEPRAAAWPRRVSSSPDGRAAPGLPDTHRLAPPPAPDPARIALALLGLVRFGDPRPVAEPPAPILPGVPRDVRPADAAKLAARLSGSVWLVARGGGGGIAPGIVGGQLGGAQAGLRIAYLLDRRHRLALAARATTPLGAGQRELAAGVEWQPTGLPIRLVAERRFVVAGDGTGGPALGVVAGLGPKRIGGGVTLEAYGQAGIIRRGRTERYADGAAHLAHPLLDLGGARLDVGAGAWGGAQRGAARLDVGPTLALTLPVAQTAIRLSLDWRERVAGRARPGSGIALTLGTDF